MHKSHLTYPMDNLCPICKTIYASDVKFCIKDGARLIAATNPFEKAQPVANNPFEQTESTLPNPFEQKTSKPANPFERPAIAPNQFYPKADLGNRFLAALIDGLIFVGLAIPGSGALVFAFFAAYGGEEELTVVSGIFGILLILIPIAYLLVKDGFGQGQSYGKKAFHLIVVDLETNTPCNKSKSAVRNLVSILLGMIPFVGNLIEPIVILATVDGRKVGDRAANTMVINKKDYFNSNHTL